MKELSRENWLIFADWFFCPVVEPPNTDWTEVDSLVRAFSGVVEIRHHELTELLGTWDRLLSDFGGDPTHSDWSRFRPLRLSREEDWSDWLAYLIEASNTGVFSANLFGPADSDPSLYANPVRVDREISYRGYRADLIVQWSNGEVAHVEVKVGDESLAKTFGTGAALRARFGKDQSTWRNYILLLSQQLSAWDSLVPSETVEPGFGALTWDDVCVALRRGLQAGEHRHWQAWAYAFVGSIEQMLLGFPGHLIGSRPLEGLGAKVRVLKEGYADGSRD